jgi:hypothetical protein
MSISYQAKCIPNALFSLASAPRNGTVTFTTKPNHPVPSQKAKKKNKVKRLTKGKKNSAFPYVSMNE